ncbi:MAG: DUF2232 domain-containing protein [Desulfuromonadales bacterium]|jgi:uncharacterized protein YybS (DUF2232 family)|nr:DUF2232 domain-containing protein [Desulfuromonadales bacterium]
MRQQAALTVAGIALTLLCFLGATQLGPTGAMLNFLTPLPVCYLSLRLGMRTGVMVVAVSGLVLGMFIPLYSLVTYFGLFGVGSLLLPYLLKRKIGWDWAAAATVVAVTIAALLLVGSYLLVSDESPGVLLDQYLQAELDLAVQAYQDAGLTGSELEQMKEIAGQVAEFIRSTFFGLYLTGALAVQLLTLALLHRFKASHYQIHGVPFARWRLPAPLIWALILSGFALLVPQELLQLVARNALALLLPLYFLQGLAVVSNFLQRRALPPLLKGMIYLMVFIFNPLPLIVTGVGVFDLWIDFRRPRKKDL